jgi:hypothetical protein
VASVRRSQEWPRASRLSFNFSAFPLMEARMFSKSIPSSTSEPSFFYLLMAATCFQRAGCTRHPNAGGALRDIGCEYLAKASPHAGVFAVRHR